MSWRRKSGLVLGALTLALTPADARAQGPGTATVYAPVGSGFVPFGGGYAGARPYRYGTTFGSLAPSRPPGMSLAGRLSTRFDAMGDGPRRPGLEPLTPLRDMPGGMSGSTLAPPGGMTLGGGMRGPARPPVGSYPFRIPPLLTGPAGPMIGM